MAGGSEETRQPLELVNRIRMGSGCGSDDGGDRYADVDDVDRRISCPSAFCCRCCGGLVLDNDLVKLYCCRTGVVAVRTFLGPGRLRRTAPRCSSDYNSGLVVCLVLTVLTGASGGKGSSKS